MRWGTALVVISVLAAVLSSALRLVYGVDFTDEALYVAVPWRFVRGEIPIVDEYNMSQLAALFCVPVLKMWSAIFGNEAIVLVMRVLHLLLRAGTATVVAWSLSALLGSRLAIVASLLVVAVVPFGSPSVSYNTVSALAFTAGCFAGLATERGWRSAALAGALHAIAVLAYPPFSLAVLVFLVARLVVIGRAFSMAYVAAAAVACVPHAMVFAHAGLDAIQRMVEFAGSATKPAPFTHRFLSLGDLLLQSPPWPLLFGSIALLTFVAGKRKRAAAWLLPLVPLVAAVHRLPMLYTSIGFTAWMAIIGGAVALVLWRDDEDAQRLIACVWIPGLAAGFITAFFSSNRAVNFGVGALGAAQAAVALLALLAMRRFGATPRVAFAIASLCWMTPAMQQFLPGTIYRDDAVPRLTADIARGPYAGIFTTPQRRAWIEQLDRDLARVDDPSRSVFFYYNFPGGYLLTPMRPAGPSVWTLDEPGARNADGLPGSFSRLPDVIVRLAVVPGFRRSASTPGDPLDAAFRDYRPVVVREDYQILVRPGL